MGLNTYYLTRSRAIVDEESLERTEGAQINWAAVTADSDGAKRVKAGTVVSRRSDGKVEPRAYALTLTSVVVATNVATATKTAHGFSVGESVYISGSNLSYANGVKTIASVPDADTFTYAATGSNATATGTITASRVATEILATDACNLNYAEGYNGEATLVGGVLYKNLLPDATGSPLDLPSEYKSELVTAGCTFKFRTYSDTRAS